MTERKHMILSIKKLRENWKSFAMLNCQKNSKDIIQFTSSEWNEEDEEKKSNFLMQISYDIDNYTLNFENFIKLSFAFAPFFIV